MRAGDDRQQQPCRATGAPRTNAAMIWDWFISPPPPRSRCSVPCARSSDRRDQRSLLKVMRALGDLPPELRRQAIDVARRQSIVVRHKPADDEEESVDRRDLVGAAQDVDYRPGTPALLGVPEADKLFARQLEAVGMVFDRLADKSDPPRCVVCRRGSRLTPRPRLPSSVGSSRFHATSCSPSPFAIPARRTIPKTFTSDFSPRSPARAPGTSPPGRLEAPFCPEADPLSSRR